jgi:hypothetical protein
MKVGATILTLTAVVFLGACSGKPEMTQRETTTTTTTYTPPAPPQGTVIEQNKTTTRVVPAD